MNAGRDTGGSVSGERDAPGRRARLFSAAQLDRARSVAAFAAAETVGRAATWLTIFLLPWILPPEEYGVVVLLATFEGLATGLLMLGQDRAVMWRGAAQGDLARRRPWIGTAVVVTTGAGIVGLGLIAAVSALGIDDVLQVPIWPHLGLLGLAVIFVNVNRVVLAFVRVAGRTGEFASYRTATGLGRLVVTLGLAAATGTSLAFPVGAVLGTFIGGLRLWVRILRGLLNRLAVRDRRIRLMVAYGAPLSLHALAGNSLTFIDRWLIGSMLGLAVVGSYGWYYMLGSAVAFLYAALNVYYEPAIYRECRQSGSVGTLREYLGISMVAAGLYSVLGAGVTTVAGGLVPSGVQADPGITRIVLIAHWFYPIYLAANYLLSAFGRTGRVAGVSSIALLVVLAANLVLIPRLGAVGGAWATLAGNLALIVAAGFMLRRLGIGARVLIGPSVAVGAFGAAGALLPGAGGLATAAVGLIVYGAVYVLRGR